jgi:hypothetical protein
VGHMMEEPPSPRVRRPTLSEDLSQLILRMLAKQPGQRPQRWSTWPRIWRERLCRGGSHRRGHHAGGGRHQILAAPPAKLVAATTTFRQAAKELEVEPEVSRPRRRWPAVAGAGAAALAAVAVVLWAPWRGGQEMRPCLRRRWLPRPLRPSQRRRRFRLVFRACPEGATVWLDGQRREVPLVLAQGRSPSSSCGEGRGLPELHNVRDARSKPNRCCHDATTSAAARGATEATFIAVARWERRLAQSEASEPIRRLFRH